MKKTVLLLVSAMLATVGAMAQTKPTVEYTNFTDAVVGQTNVYLYNVEAGLFLTGGNAWYTRACVVDNGLGSKNGSNYCSFSDFTSGKANVRGFLWLINEESSRTIDETEYYCYSFSNKTGANYLTADDWSEAGECTGIWVDGGNTRPYNGWTAEVNPDQTFKLGYIRQSTDPETGSFVYSKADGYFGVQYLSSNDDTNAYISAVDAYNTWALVSADEYERVQPLLNLYYVQVKLSQLIQSAKAQGSTVDFTAYEALATAAPAAKAEDINTQRTDVVDAINLIGPAIELGEAIAAAKAVDAARDYSKFETLYNDATATATQLTEATTLLKALTTLKKTIDEAEATHDYAPQLAVYNSDESTLDQVNAAKALVDDFVALKKAIDAAKAENPTLDFSAAEDIYKNSAATAEQVAEANSIILDVVANAKVSVDNPLDYTSFITNPTFDTIGDFTGWSGTAFSAGGTTSTCAEHYSKNYDTYQDVNGGSRIPNGIYEVKVNAFYRAGSIANDWATRNDPAYRHAKLYGTSGDETYTGDVPALSSWATDETTIGTTTGDNGELRIPDTMKDFTDFEDAGLAKSTSLYIPVENGKLRIGTKKETLIDTDWSIYDNFTLTYYGSSIEAYKLWSKVVAAEAAAKLENIDFDEEVYTTAVKQAYDEAASTALNAASTADIKAAAVAVNPAANAVIANIAAWKDYLAKKTEVEEYLAENPLDGPKADDLGEYIADGNEEEPSADRFPNGSAAYILINRTLSTEEIAAEVEFLADFLKDAIAGSAKPGDDVTNLLVNPAFADGWTGWQNPQEIGDDKVYQTSDGGTNCVEVFQKVVDIYQVVKGAPAGVYEISCQAFERPAGNGAYNGTEKSVVYLYLNEFKTQVMNITKDLVTADNAVSGPGNGANCYLNENGEANNVWPYDYTFSNENSEGFVPNSMQGASYAFQAGRYQQSAFGLVEDGDDMKIGLTSNGVTPEWVLWANFKLTFWGKDETAVSNVLETKLNTAQEFITENEDNMSKGEVDALTEAITNGVLALNSEGAWDALIALNKAIIAAEANVTAVANLKEAITELDDAYTAAAESDEGISNTAQDAYDELCDELGDPSDEGETYIKGDDIFTADIEAMIEKIKLVIATMKMPDYSNASDENPVDFTSVIENPSFETGNLNGWTNSGSINAQAQDNDSFDNKKGTYYCERWHVNGTIDINQTVGNLIALPAGTYDITAYVYSTAPDAVFYANGEKVSISDSKLYTITLKLDEPGTIKFGVSWSDTGSQWTTMDDFHLTYYGTESEKQPTEIAEVEAAETAQIAAIYSITGAKLAALQKGINIVQYTNGKVAKVYVK